jgi:hypothetical protein
MWIERLRKGVLVAALLVAAGCSNGDSADTRAEDTGSVQVALVIVPADVQCVSITATGTRVRQQNFNVMPGQMSVLSMDGLPVGQVTFTGQAFPGGCGGGGAMGAAPNYVADPVTTQINATGVTSLTLNMRRNGQASIDVDFETGGMCVPAGSACMPGSSTPCCTGLACQADPTGINSCQPQNMCAPGGTQCDATTVCCSGLVCQADPAGLTTCQPPAMCSSAGSSCGPGTAQQCCAGLTCELDPSGLARCQPPATCQPNGAQCGAVMNQQCCAGLACQLDPAGIPRCQIPATCRPPGALCGPGMTQQCCAGLTCLLDPAGGTAICQ